MIVNPDTGTVVVYLGVLESSSATDTNHALPLVQMLAAVAAE